MLKGFRFKFPLNGHVDPLIKKNNFEIRGLLGAHAAKSWLPGPPSGRGTLGPPCIRCGTLIRNVGPPMWVKNPRPPPWWRCGTSVQNRGPPNSLVWNLETLGPPCIRCGTLCCWDWPCEAVQLGDSLRFWAASMSTLLHRCVLLCCCYCPVNLHREQAFDPRPSPSKGARLHAAVPPFSC